MGGIVSKITDDVLGFDPNGGGIYSVANDILGSTVADNILGLDPNGGGIVPLANTAANAAVAYALGDAAGGLLGGDSAILGTTGSSAAAADASFLAADAAQLAAQGLGESQIASTLAASGASSSAASLAASMAVNNVGADVMAQQLNNLSTNTGLFSQASDANAMQDFAQADASQLAKQTGNSLAVEQNLIASGVDPVDAASLAQNASLATGVTPTQGMWDEFTNYLKQNPDVLNLLGKAGAAGIASNVTTPSVQQVPAYKPLNNMPVSDPAYYQQIQNYYTGYMPNMPKDVATPLQQWYSQGYTGPDEATKKAFGG